jgi:hypothetical protein
MRRVQDAQDDLSTISARTKRNLKQIQLDSELRQQQLNHSYAARMRALEDDRQQREREADRRVEQIRTDSLIRQQRIRREAEADRERMERLLRKR